jgi:hypothetical protein
MGLCEGVGVPWGRVVCRVCVRASLHVRCKSTLSSATSHSEKYLRLLETDRLYHKTVRDYEDEIQKNEKLQAKLTRAN